MNSQALLDELRAFFRLSATNAERVPASLKALLSVKTALEGIVEDALAKGQSVVIAGTAGSGKTHLIDPFLQSTKYHVVPDLTTKQQDWSTLFSGGQVLVAGNEGAFLMGAKQGHSRFAEIVEILHRIQLGEDVTDSDLVVIDAAAFDPAGAGAIGQMVGNPIISEFIASEDEPYRTAAWHMLSNEIVRDRLARVVEVASSATGAEGFTFRQLWQFVADIASRGSELQAPWFWRVLCGNTLVSERVRETLQPSHFALPHVGARLWYGDLHGVKNAFLPEAEPILKLLLGNVEHTRSARHVLRLVAAFGLKSSPLDALSERRSDTWSKISKGNDVRKLIRHINSYMHYGLLQLQQDDHLQLWTQTDTERRELKPRIQISLGSIDPDKFELRRNRVAANSNADGKDLQGRRVMLLLKGTSAVLDVTKDLVDGIDHVRSHRLLDRKDVEHDWRLLNFLAAVARHQENVSTLHVGHLDFRSRAGNLSTWDLSDGMVTKR